ncbi:N-acetylmuramoyl-L-alanine amidase [Alkaliphilus sp. MSJ-5]|uniref:N-acetylmuramoyl-L-alanine amidase n=1 Tax=Alkaliphilus flagellatus TaxID=2841507 RepID=A0ABS6G5M8_9FIRM|nr:N-acetylmuramoyl-L-alanine amidase [Alkaliphilus flagellatus]MBU5677787.1 N-acetylmuramoyl-L-alanine amidase [Alkaliphilus flagellatus]
MKRYIVVIDPGHGGTDPGAVGPTGLKENHVAWRIACMVADILMRYGIEVIFTRVGDEKISLDKRVQIANKSKADFFISIHINSASNPLATGTEVFAYSKASEGNKLAGTILDSLLKEINLKNRGIKYDRLQVVATTKIPACLVEVAFINNPTEEQLLKQDEFLEKAAVGIAKGILNHIGIDYMSKEDKSMSWEEKQGLEHLENLVKKKIIDSPDYWKDRLLEPMPTWAVFALIDRITDK